MKVQDRQNGPSGLPEKTGWLRACSLLFNQGPRSYFVTQSGWEGGLKTLLDFNSF